MARLFRTFPLLLALFAPLAVADVGAGVPRAAETDLKPRVAELGEDAFTPGAAGADTTPGARVLETEPRQAVAFTDLMLRWQVDLPAQSLFAVSVRTSSNGSAWQPWIKVTASDDPPGPDEPANNQWSDAVQTPLAAWYQLRIELVAGTGGAQPKLHNLAVHTVDSRMPGGKQPAADVPAERVAGSVGRPAFVSRTAWGNPQGEGAPNAPPAYYTAKHLVVHHTADSNSLSPGTTWADRVRAIWSFHTYSRGWGDIGYNWLIDPNGVIYAGRAGSTDPARDAVGFHDTANYGSMGVSMIGTYTSVAPSPATINSLVEILAWKAGDRGINPQGTAYYYGCARSSYCAPFNSGAVVATISGHRQVTPGHTTCPGDSSMGLLPSIRQRVADRLRSSPNPAPPQAGASAQLVSARVLRGEITAGEAVPIEFTVRNGPVAMQTQQPDGGRANDLSSGWVYDEAECFLGPGSNAYPAFPKETGRLRVMLGISGSGPAQSCSGDTAGFPWRWGVGDAMAPNETRTIHAYVRFQTPGTYTFRASLINEYVKAYGADGNGAETGAGTVVVHAENRPPALSLFDGAFNEQATVYQLQPVPAGVLARSTNPTSVLEGAYVGAFPWNGTSRDWGAGGPLGQTDRFIIRQVRAFYVPVSGSYAFRLASDDGAWLWIDGAQILSNHGLHGKTAVETTIQLEAGPHVLAVKYFDYVGGAYSGYVWRPPGDTSWSAIPFLPQTERIGSTWKREPQMTLAAHDLGGAGLRELRFSIDGGAEQVAPYGYAIMRAGPGAHVVEYWGVDNNGVASHKQRLTYTVDPNLQFTRKFLSAVTR